MVTLAGNPWQLNMRSNGLLHTPDWNFQVTEPIRLVHGVIFRTQNELRAEDRE
jgi:hypothetical protein